MNAHRKLVASILLVPTLSGFASQGPPLLEGDSNLSAIPWSNPIPSADVDQMLADVALLGGHSVALALEDAIANHNVEFVKLESAGRTAASDATTIGVNIDDAKNRWDRAIALYHEGEHWLRSSVEGANTGNPNATDPLMNGPCGFCAHAEMGADALNRRGYVTCDLPELLSCMTYFEWCDRNESDLEQIEVMLELCEAAGCTEIGDGMTYPSTDPGEYITSPLCSCPGSVLCCTVKKVGEVCPPLEDPGCGGD